MSDSHENSPTANPTDAGASAPTPPEENAPPREDRRTRALISIGVGLALSGIALSVADGDVARWLVISGVVIAFIALHRYGRLGPQAV
jgi:hypothetical protein